MTIEEIVAKLERPYNYATVEKIEESFFNNFILGLCFAIVAFGLFLLIRIIWTGITFLVEFGLDMFWKWKNADIKDYSQSKNKEIPPILGVLCLIFDVGLVCAVIIEILSSFNG